VPKFSGTPGAVEHAGPTLGEHNRQVYSAWLGYSDMQVKELASREII